MRIILAPTASLAATVEGVAVSVEAEYGDITIQGSRYTAAHHGLNSENPCPCVDEGIPRVEEGEIILISHIDLDTLGGVYRAAEPFMKDIVLHHEASFWRLVEFVDVRGPHKLALFGASERDIAALYAYWAWSAANRWPRRENDKVHDVTDEVLMSLRALSDILHGDEELLDAGQAFMKAGGALNAESFVELKGYTIIRVSPVFVSHMYTTPKGVVCDAVVAFNTETGGITLSFAEKEDPRNACEIMQAVFGLEAGGHRGIAGSPRGSRYGLGMAHRVAEMANVEAGLTGASL